MHIVLVALVIALFVTGCATPGAPPPVPVDVSTTKLAVATHNDLMAAAKRATAAGYPSRAALWLAEDAKLTAIEAQISACANSIRADLPQASTASGFAGPFDAEEALTETVGSFVGASARTKILCKPMPVVLLPILPKP